MKIKGTPPVAIDADFSTTWVCVEEVMRHFPVTVTRRKLFEWGRMHRFPAPWRAGFNQKSKPYFKRESVIEAVRERFFLNMPDAVLAFEPAIRAPRKKSKSKA